MEWLDLLQVCVGGCHVTSDLVNYCLDPILSAIKQALRRVILVH